MQVLEFIFSSFWVWFGCLVLIGAGCSGIAEIITALRGRPNGSQHILEE